MEFSIPIVSLVFALIFLVLVFIETRVRFHGVFAIIGTLFNLLAVFFLFFSGTDLIVALLFILIEILLFSIIVSLNGGKDVI